MKTTSAIRTIRYWSGLKQWRENGAKNLSVLHTRDRKVADTEAFVKPIRDRARGVLRRRPPVAAGRFLSQHAHAQELSALLSRGGVDRRLVGRRVDPASFMVRGDTKGNEKMIGDHTVGLGFLKNAAVDQHLLRRNRQFDMLEVIDAHPQLLGIGLDEDTAIVVQGDQFDVIGKSYAVIYSNRPVAGASGRFYFMGAGDRFDMDAGRRCGAPRSGGRSRAFDRRNRPAAPQGTVKASPGSAGVLRGRRRAFVACSKL